MGWVNDMCIYLTAATRATVHLREDKERMGAEGVSELSKVSHYTVCWMADGSWSVRLFVRTRIYDGVCVRVLVRSLQTMCGTGYTVVLDNVIIYGVTNVYGSENV